STFVKPFLRTYAEYLGLDATLLVEEYRVHYEPRGEAEPMQHFAPPRRRVPRRSRYASGPPGPGTAVVVLVLAILVIFAVLGLTSGGNKSSTSPQSANQTKKKAAPKKKATPPPPPKPARAVVRVVPLAGGTYVCLDRGAGTKKVFEGILPPNVGKKWRGSRVRIIIGHTPIKLTANGKAVNVPSSAAAVAYDITPKRTKPIPPGPNRPCQ